ncbi:tyrosyl-DNA phosphodiesterase 1 [Aspergillus udagawae]|nr:tyrosyl-DNA phosphodiesterase 1 [Aspergillus udagawae]
MEPEDLTDPDLKAAIAASLRDLHDNGADPTDEPQQIVVDLTAESDDDEVIPVFPKSKSVIGSDTDAEEDRDDVEDEDEDDEDEDLKRAIALSLQDSEDTEKNSPYPSHGNKEHGPPPETESSATDHVPSQPSGLLGLNRRQMEEERLARIAKRKADDVEAIDHRQAKYSKNVSNQPARQSSSGSVSTEYASKIGVPQARYESAKLKPDLPNPSRTPAVQFPKGVVKKTYAQYCPRTGDDITIEEVFQSSDLELAVFSSFLWDMEWLFSKIDTKRTRFLLVMQAKDELTKRQYEAETASMSNLRLCFPPMEGQVNCMHSKLMLLFHPGYLRIVAPTANLTPYDWGEMGGVMENSAFLIDLPRKATTTAVGSKTAFQEDLAYFLRASTLHENIISRLDEYDFSQTSHIMLVHTIGGSHTGNAWRRTGHCGLGRAVNALGLRASKPINIDFVTSSVGSLTDEFLRSIYLASQGDDGITEFTLRTSKTFPARNPNDTDQLIHKNTAEEWKDRFRVYFPSQTTIEQSRGGPDCAGTICFQSKWYEKPKFPRHVLRDCKSRRAGLLMHNKILFMRPDEPLRLPDNSQCRGWAYVGSANLSESAWGRLVQDQTTKQPKLNCRNWECGVLVPVLDRADSSDKVSNNNSGKGANESADMLDVFRGTVPVPMTVPGQRYGPGLKPWFFLSKQE